MNNSIKVIILYMLFTQFILSYHIKNVEESGIFKGYIFCSNAPLYDVAVKAYERDSFSYVVNKTDEKGYFELDIDRKLKLYMEGYLEFYYPCPKFDKIMYLESKYGEIERDTKSYLQDKIINFGVIDPSEAERIKRSI
uniref:Carboxypeptidase-like regulatory domain-containing protein n=1 Tax=Parastrongyloides trichosuri TaxID=131310 RepID=A0A0N4Z730_PARTI